MDEMKNLNGNGEILNSVPEENKVKLDFNSIESTESNIPLEERFGTAQEYDDVSIEPEATEEIAEVKIEFEEQPAVEEVMPEVIPEVQPVQPQPVPVQQPAAEPVKEKAKKKKKEKSPEEKKAIKAKRNKRFGAFVRAFVVTILSVATLWGVVYTIDHVLAAQGYPPIFVIEKTTYEISYLSDENAILEEKNESPMLAYNYDCLGYKIQHVYDENCNAEVDFVWAGEEGAVDILFNQGKLFEMTEEETAE